MEVLYLQMFVQLGRSECLLATAKARELMGDQIKVDQVVNQVCGQR
jgi:hypothetical protein